MTPYTIFRKIIAFGVMWEPQFLHPATFYVRKIQTFLKRGWLNTTTGSKKLTNFKCAFLI